MGTFKQGIFMSKIAYARNNSKFDSDEEVKHYEANKIMKTSDYSMFNPIHYNREIKEKFVQSLMASLKAFNDLHLHPIIVDKEMNVVDGQHRLEAAKRLDIPIYYVIDETYTPEKMLVINIANSTWNSKDYVLHWAKQGKQPYIDLLKFLETFDVKVSTFIKSLSSTSSRVLAKIKSGTFDTVIGMETVHHFSLTKQIFEIMLHNKECNKDYWRSSYLHSGCRIFFSSPNIDTDLFFKQAEKYPGMLKKRHSPYTIIENLIEVYCFRRKSSNKLMIHTLPNMRYQIVSVNQNPEPKEAEL